jgi:2-dehydropantoate 2-reductase
MKIAVMGVGGTGGYFGGLLARAGEDVTFIARGAHLEALRTHGLQIKSPLFGDFTLKVRATNNPQEIGPVDLVLFCIKSYDTEVAVQQIVPLVGPETMVVSLQNGIDNEERLAQVVGEDAVLGAVAFVTAKIEAPGVILQTTKLSKLVLGELDGNITQRACRLQQMLENAGITTNLRSDIQVALWEKFLFICALSGMTALTRLPIGQILACHETSEMTRQLMSEVAQVARKRNVALPPDCVQRNFVSLEQMEPQARGSLYGDLVSGHKMELETLNGTVVRLGNETNVHTPMNFAVYASLKPYASIAGEASQRK